MKHHKDDKLNIDTRVVHGNTMFDPHTGAVSFPIYQTATFRHPGLNETTGYDYSRLQNPTREELEKTMANLESGKHGFAFSSGMAAISTIIKIFSPGDHIIVSDDLYGGTFRLFDEIYSKYGIEFNYVDTSSIENVINNLKLNTVAIFIETPSNPLMKITDIATISKIAKEKNIMLIVDNTFLTPYCQRPIEIGADIVVHSASKYLGGHNDTIAGIIIVNDDDLAEKIKLIHKSEGSILSSFDSWLIIRGIKTLGIRFLKQQENAAVIAQWLKNNNYIEYVYYPGFSDHIGHEICKRQSSGFGAMISFTVKDVKSVARVLENIKIIMFAESLGGVESLITYPISQTHTAIPEEMCRRLGINDRLLRLSVGIENVDDLIYDLKQALR